MIITKIFTAGVVALGYIINWNAIMRSINFIAVTSTILLKPTLS
jgi:hypothetical protein